MPPPPVPVVVSVFHQSGFKEEDGDLGQTGEASLPFGRGQTLPRWKGGLFQGAELCWGHRGRQAQDFVCSASESPPDLTGPPGHTR